MRLLKLTRELDLCVWFEPLSPPCLNGRGGSVKFRLWDLNLFTSHRPLPLFLFLFDATAGVSATETPQTLENKV